MYLVDDAETDGIFVDRMNDLLRATRYAAITACGFLHCQPRLRGTEHAFAWDPYGTRLTNTGLCEEIPARLPERRRLVGDTHVDHSSHLTGSAIYRSSIIVACHAVVAQ